jgi:ATP-dependent DNA helicase RecG
MSLQAPLAKSLRTNKAHLDRLSELGVKTVADLLLFFPRTYEDKSEYITVSEIRTDRINNIKVTIDSIFHRTSKTGKSFTKAIVSDHTGNIEVIWFNQKYLQRVLFKGIRIILSGKAKYSSGKTTLQSPAFEEIKKEQTHTGRIIPVYHQTEGITSKWLREKIKPLIDEWMDLLEDYMPPEIIKKYDLMEYKLAVKEVHFPTSEKRLEKARFRLSFDELFLLQLKALQKKWYWQNIKKDYQKKIERHKDVDSFLASLPFKLTEAQKRSLNEILCDLNKPYPMSRLLQGDVGSGKTVVAGAAILNVIKHGYQAVLMAPTEILAKQHYRTLFKHLQPLGLNIQFLSGSTTASRRSQILSQLASGSIDLLIGTHALIQEGVDFKNLGLAVIDEQHRFGVKQREILKSKGGPHLLSLTATPIPRTLAMTIYGDQDLSVIDEMPPGRKTVITRVVPENKRSDAYRWIENQIQKGRQAFVICPLIDESDVLEVKSAIHEYKHLQENIFKTLKVGLIHGKIKPDEKESVMEKFKKNETNILVSTSVIEVGIDVPNATIMLIEGAERFGLSQLHQFRGRVGRGEHQSYCFLFSKNSSEDSKTRLNAMVMHSDGFKLSEIDLQLRGPGEIYGVKQSGIPDLKMASLTDSVTISLARKAAMQIISQDPELKNLEKLNKKIKELSEVFVND